MKILIKNIKKHYENKLIRWLIIPVLLGLLWLGLSLALDSYRSITVLTYPHNSNEKTNFRNGYLLKHQKITGEFKAMENNLGILSIKLYYNSFVDFDKEEILLFRIKEKGSKEWHYENEYRAGILRRQFFFPFGFPQISDSKNKIYFFELVSLRGNRKNAAEVVSTNPIFRTSYKFSRQHILSDYKSTGSFIYKKIVSFFTDFDALVSSLLFTLPLFIYFFFNLFFEIVSFIFGKANKGKKITRKYQEKFLFLNVIFCIIFADALFIRFEIYTIYLFVVLLWAFLMYKKVFNARESFYVFTFLLTVSLIDIYISKSFHVVKFSSYAYFFLVLGIIKLIIDEKREV